MALTHLNPTLLNLIPLSGNGALTLPAYGARALTQTLEPIGSIAGGGNVLGSTIRRTVGGKLVNLTSEIFHKYASTVTYRDGSAPAMDDAWHGEIVEMACAAELSYPNGGTPQRTPVSGSTRTEEWLTFYRPVLIMMVTGIKHSFSEYEGLYTTTVDFQEV